MEIKLKQHHDTIHHWQNDYYCYFTHNENKQEDEVGNMKKICSRAHTHKKVATKKFIASDKKKCGRAMANARANIARIKN